MKTSLSPQVRVIALALVTALAGVGLGIYTLGQAQRHDSEAAAPVKPVRITKPVVTPARPTKTTQTPVTIALRAGLPAVVAKDFAKHDTVVVEVFSSESDVDRLALKESVAGAGLAGSGFVKIDVTRRSSDAAARKLTEKLGVLNTPTVLVFKKPGTLFVKINGFSDHETIAQAAVNAAASPAS